MYYGDKRESVCNIGYALQAKGWKIYGYKEDQSDSMTDYYDPASWDGIATKNGCIACIDISAYNVKYYSGKEIYEYTKKNAVYVDHAKIEQLTLLANDPAATEGEKSAALAAIQRINDNADQKQEEREASKKLLYTWPTFQENPKACNWHIESNGVIMAKGKGAFQFSSFDFKYHFDFENLCYKQDFISKLNKNDKWDMEKIEDAEKFKEFILKLDAIANEKTSIHDGTEEGKANTGRQGYKKIIVTEYKTENKAETIENGSIHVGAHFILNTSFNYGCFKGLVYEITDVREGYFSSYKMNGKLNKLCKGNASTNNRFGCHFDKFNKWIEKGSISFVNIVEVKTPYEVEKWVKIEDEKPIKKQQTRTNKTTPEATGDAQTSDNNILDGYTYTIAEDIDTRDNSALWVLKINERLERDEYIKVSENLKTIKGYYSKFKHGFIFKYDPSDVLNGNAETEATGEEKTSKDQKTAETITDISTTIIEELKLVGQDWQQNTEYRQKLKTYIQSSINSINKNVIALIEYDGLKNVLFDILLEHEQQKETEKAEAQKQEITEKINKTINSLQEKINNLSGDYKTNTWKRQNEQAGRQQKIDGWQLDIDVLRYLLNLLDERPLTIFEQALITGSFRDEIHSYYQRDKAAKSGKYSAVKEIEYPKINYQYPDNWYNKEVPKMQKRLQKGNIHNTEDLHKAIAEYENILNVCRKPIDKTAQKIKKLVSEAKMMQKGDIQFTPSNVAERLIELANIQTDDKVLEPSAGIGSIADEIRKYTNNVDVIECVYSFREILELKGYNIVANDFLEYQPEGFDYDVIVMNPPFSNNQDIEHIRQAYSMLANDGRLIAITSHHWTFANDKKSNEFRNWLDNMPMVWYTEDLEAGTFEMTGVASKILVIENRAEAKRETA